MGATKNAFQPDYAVPPGWILDEMLEARSLSHAEFARRCGRSPKLVSDIVAGRAPVEPEKALQFEKVLGMDAGLWLNIEADYQLHLARKAEAARLERAVAWYRAFPVKDLVQRGCMPKPESEADGVGKLLGFFGVASVDAWSSRFSEACVAYRHSPTFKSSEQSLTAWLRMGEVQGEAQECAEFNEPRFKANLKAIRGLTVKTPAEFLPEMKRLCNESGVAFAVVPCFPKTALSGAARWLTPRKGLIQQSVRHLVNDHFWWTFFHEAAHLLLHSKKDVFVDEKGRDGTDIEREADEWAGSFLVPKPDWERFKAARPRSEAAVTSFARSHGIHPGIVVGMLQHEGVLPWDHLNRLKQKYRWN